MLFATAAHGFKSGGFNIGFGSLPIADREFQDEGVEHFEFGVKSHAGGRPRTPRRERFSAPITTIIRTPRSSARSSRSAMPRKSSSTAWRLKALRC